MCKPEKPKSLKIERKDSLATILQNLEAVYQTHVSVRASFTYIPEDLIGANVIPSKLFYEINGYKMEIHLDKPITEDMRVAYNNRGHWLNQNAIIRLYTFLNSYQFVGDENSGIEIDLKCVGGKEVDLVRRLRNIFAHGTGKYEPTNRKHQEFAKEIAGLFWRAHGY